MGSIRWQINIILLDKAFGKGRITVDNKSPSADGNKGQLTFKTTTPPKGEADNTSVLKVTSASAGLLGKAGILGMDYGESNRINTNVSLKNSGLTGQSGLVAKDIKIAKLDKDGNEVKDANGNTVYEYEVTNLLLMEKNFSLKKAILFLLL